MGLTDRADLLRKAALGRGRPGLGGAGSGGTRDEESFEREARGPLTADLAQTIPFSISGFSIREHHATKWPLDWPGPLPCHRNSPPIPGLLQLPSGICPVVDYDILASELLGGPVPSLGHREVSVLWRVPPPAKELDPDRVVFLDTETTGLSGGTGTYVFMVGLGRFRGESFRLRQLFLRDLHLEEAFLEALAVELAEAEALVTFNGKSFDLPLLETRFVRWRKPFPAGSVLHLDLLYPARRWWRGRLPSCSLGSLEREILGLTREGDVPGEFIPYLYFRYLREGNLQGLEAVFGHNAHDISTLAALWGLMIRAVRDPIGHLPQPHDLLAAAADLAVGGDLPGSLQCYMAYKDGNNGRIQPPTGSPGDVDSRSADGDCRAENIDGAGNGVRQAPDAADTGRILQKLSMIYKKLRLEQHAESLWLDLAASRTCATTLAHVELAKLWEHRRKDPSRALAVVNQALNLVREQGWVHTAGLPRDEERELLHRRDRLVRKLNGKTPAETASSQPGK